MSKNTKKLPTAKELAFYRSKAVDGSYIGKNQLAAVFAALDAETARADLAEQWLLSVSEAAKLVHTQLKERAPLVSLDPLDFNNEYLGHVLSEANMECCENGKAERP